MQPSEYERVPRQCEQPPWLLLLFCFPCCSPLVASSSSRMVSRALAGESKATSLANGRGWFTLCGWYCSLITHARVHTTSNPTTHNRSLAFLDLVQQENESSGGRGRNSFGRLAQSTSSAKASALELLEEHFIRGARAGPARPACLRECLQETR